MADSLNVQVQDGSVLIEDRQRNLSVFVLTRPLHITCPWDKERWSFHAQEQVDMFQKHLDWHARQQPEQVSEWKRELIRNAFTGTGSPNRHIYVTTEGIIALMDDLDTLQTEVATLKAREKQELATENLAWANTATRLTAERDELAKKVAQLEAAAKNPQGE